MKFLWENELNARSKQHSLSPQINNRESSPLRQATEVIKVRELDKRYTHANPKLGKCTLKNCVNSSTHWLTRQNTDYCQSDMICHQHARIWMQVKDLIVEPRSPREDPIG